jgi:hypothetical protein
MAAMSMNGTSPAMHLDERLFKNFWFIVGWFGFLTVVLRFVSWPLRNIALVYWVYGKKGYFIDGIRVEPGKPTVFSNGIKASTFPDLVTGFAAFFITVMGLTMLLIFFLRLYERLPKRR